MSGGKGKGPKFELKLNLSPPGGNSLVATATRSASVSPTSPPSSCISSEFNQDNYLSSPEATSMMLVGCPRCLMYVMLADEGVCCPKCKSNVLLDVVHQNSTLSSKKARKN